MPGMTSPASPGGHATPSLVGNNLRHYRLLNGLSLSELAARLGWGADKRSYLSKVEHGQIRLGDPELLRFASALHITVDDLREPRDHASDEDEDVESILRTAMAEVLEQGEPIIRSGIQRYAQVTTRRLLHQEREAERYRSILRQAGRGKPVIREIGIPRAAGHEQHFGRDIETCMRAAIQLVESVALPPETGSREIIISWQGNESLVEASGHPYLREQWVNAFRVALERGWTIAHLIDFSGSAKEQQKKAQVIMLNLLAFLGTRGRYLPYLLPAPGHGATATRHVVVPGMGALVIRGIQEAVYYPPGPDYVEQLAVVTRLREREELLFTQHERDSSEWNALIAGVEQAPGDRYLVMDGLSPSTMPLEVHRERRDAVLALRAKDAAVQRLARDLYFYREQRVTAITRHLATWRYWDICPARTLDRLVRLGESNLDGMEDTFAALGAPKVTATQRIAQLNNIISLMRDFPNYELVLLDDPVEADACRSYHMVKAGQAVLLEFWRPDAGESADADFEHITFEIRNPALVHTFFKSPIWQTYISPLPDEALRAKKRRLETIERLQGAVADLRAIVAAQAG